MPREDETMTTDEDVTIQSDDWDYAYDFENNDPTIPVIAFGKEGYFGCSVYTCKSWAPSG